MMTRRFLAAVLGSALAAGAWTAPPRRSAVGRGQVVLSASEGSFPGGSALVLRDVLERAEVTRRPSGGGDVRWTSVAVGRNKTVPVCQPVELPSAVVHFVGGAVLGQFPRAAYGQLVERLVSRARCSVVCTPYEVDLDHGALASKTDAAFEKARRECVEAEGWSPDAPLFGCGHSLGAKLLLLSAASGGDDMKALRLIAANNFGLKDSITALDTFVVELTGRRRPGGGAASASSASSPEDLLATALTAVGAYAELAGFDVKPTPRQTEARLAEAADLGDVTLFCFDDDDLDSSLDLAAVLKGKAVVRPLRGTHLTPVYLKLSSEDAPPDLLSAAAFVGADDRVAASFGSIADLDALADALAESLLPGRATKRGLLLSDTSTAAPRRGGGAPSSSSSAKE